MRRLAWLIACLLAAALPAGARASITPEAQRVVDRYLAATGGREAFLAEKAAHARYRVKAYGMSGTLEVWTVRPATMATRAAIGPLTLRDACTSDKSWKMDQNGKVSALDGAERSAALANTYFENEAWALPDQGGGAITTDESERDSAGTYRVLEVKPPVGPERRLYFGDETGLLDHVIYAEDNETRRVNLTEYRGEGSRLRAHHRVESSDETPGSLQEFDLESFAANPFVDPAMLEPPTAAPNDAAFLGGGGSARIPVEYSQRHILVQVSLNGGAPETFILDSGAGATAIDSSAAARHGLEFQGVIPATGAAATSTASLARLDSLRISGEAGGGVVLRGQQVVVIALARQLEPAFWRPIAGILGYDFLSRFVVDVDFDESRVTLYDPKTFRYEGGSPSLPLELADNTPVVDATIDGKYGGKFRLDLGSGSTVDIHGPFVKKNRLMEKAKHALKTVAEGVGGTFESYTCRMKRFDIGPYSWTDPIVDLNLSETGTFASEDLAGNIGSAALERFRVTFDYEGKKLYLEPGKLFGRRDPGVVSGLRLDKTEGRVIARYVLEGTPAAAAGVRIGDVVESIDGKPVAAMTADQAYSLLNDAKPGTTRTVGLVRDGARTTVRMKLRSVL